MRNNPRKQGVRLSLSRFSGPVWALEICVLIMKTPRNAVFLTLSTLRLQGVETPNS